MDRELLAYLAGIIDGEGFVGFWSKGPGKKKTFAVKVNMTDKGIVSLLHETFGGQFRLRPSKRSNWKDQWEWRVVGQAAFSTYEKVVPFLRLKIISDLLIRQDRLAT